MPLQKPILPPELKTYAAERYLADVPPRDLVVELEKKFGVTVRAAALRQWLTRSGVCRRKAELDRKTCAIVSSAKVDALAKAKAAAPREHLERWADQTIKAADRAFELVGTAERPRDLASAASAASTSIRLYRLLAGLETPATRPPGTPVFDFNFMASKPVKLTVTPEGRTEIDLVPSQPDAATPAPLVTVSPEAYVSPEPEKA